MRGAWVVEAVKTDNHVDQGVSWKSYGFGTLDSTSSRISSGQCSIALRKQLGRSQPGWGTLVGTIDKDLAVDHVAFEHAKHDKHPAGLREPIG